MQEENALAHIARHPVSAVTLSRDPYEVVSLPSSPFGSACNSTLLLFSSSSDRFSAHNREDGHPKLPTHVYLRGSVQTTSAISPYRSIPVVGALRI